MPGNPYDPRSYDYNLGRPKRRFSAEQARKKRGEADFWSGVGAALPGIGGVVGGLAGGALALSNPATAPFAVQAAGLGAGIGTGLGSGVGSFATNHAASEADELGEDEMREMMLYQALANFYGSQM